MPPREDLLDLGECRVVGLRLCLTLARQYALCVGDDGGRGGGSSEGGRRGDGSGRGVGREGLGQVDTLGQCGTYIVQELDHLALVDDV